MRRSAWRRWLTVLLATVAVLLLVMTAGAGAFTKAKVTLAPNDQGGVPTRFTFEGLTDPDAPLTEFGLTYPEGFDLSKVRVQTLTLQGLTRVPVDPETTVSGQTIKLVFGTPVQPESTLRVVMYDVVTPNQGGTYALEGYYASGGPPMAIPGLAFEYTSPTRADLIARWLDDQSWVTSLNGVRVIRIFLQPQAIVQSFPLLFRGWLVSILLVLIAFPFAIIGGLLLAFAKMSRVAPLRWLASAYINVVRGTPLFLQIFIAYIGLPIAGIHLGLFPSGVIVLALNSAAYLAEIFRAGIQSIHKGQFEASNSLGMNYYQTMRYVIIPQTLKRVLPTMTSEFILLFKDTALLSAVGVFELMLRANNFVARTGTLTPYMVAAVYYLIVTIPLINYVGRLERRLAVSEGGQVAGGRRKREVVPTTSAGGGE